MCIEVPPPNASISQPPCSTCYKPYLWLHPGIKLYGSNPLPKASPLQAVVPISLTYGYPLVSNCMEVTPSPTPLPRKSPVVPAISLTYMVAPRYQIVWMDPPPQRLLTTISYYKSYLWLPPDVKETPCSTYKPYLWLPQVLNYVWV